MIEIRKVEIPVKQFDKSYPVRTLHGTYFSNEVTEKTNIRKPAVLFIHGKGSSQTGYLPRAQALSELGANVLTFNYGGLYNFGNLNEHFTDITSAFDWLKQENLSQEHSVAVAGASYGACLATYLTVTRRIDHLLLRAPAFANKNSASRIKTILNKFSGTLLLVLSGQEEVISKNVQELFWESASTPHKQKLEIEDADHELTSDDSKQAFLNILTNWYIDISKQQQTASTS
jgi:esterase/lipase